jgi:hypothetical protein
MRQRTLKPEDLERLLQLKRRIFGTVAKKLLKDPEAPHVVTDHLIESNAGRIQKAVRDLSNYVSRIKGTTGGAGRYSSDNQATYRVYGFKEESAELGVAPKFFSTWQDLHDELFCQVSYDNNYRSRADIDSQEEYDRIGYREVSALRNSEAIYVYWHQNEYRIFHVEETSSRYSASAPEKRVYIYPLALEETRIKSILRAIVEAHYQDDYTTKLGRYLDIPVDLLKDDDSDFFHTRNFSARAADLTQARFFGTRGYQEEYRHCVAFFDAKLRALAKMDAVVQSRGGYENVAREMRKASMEELLLNAPLVVNYDASHDDTVDESDSAYSAQALQKKKYKDKYLNTLLLRNSQYFVYDTLFGEDESVQYFESGRASAKNRIPNGKDWEPNEKDVAFIEAVRKDVSCSQENTYAVLQPTC